MGVSGSGIYGSEWVGGHMGVSGWGTYGSEWVGGHYGGEGTCKMVPLWAIPYHTVRLSHLINDV